MDFEQVKDIIVDTLACDEEKVTPEARFQEDLEVDSLSLVELHMALEDALGKTIPDGEIGKMATVLPVMLLTVGFGIVGFIDDFLKVVKHQSEGFNPKQKFLCQLVFCVIFALYLYLSPAYDHRMQVPFTEIYLDLGWFYVPALLFIVLGTDNGANFTDGLDGLASSVTAVIALFLGFVSLYFGKADAQLAPISGAVFGALMGFLMFNCYPAKVFMGDTGSLALGGFVAAAAFEMGIPLFIPIFALIYLVEVLSVIIQVTYFKKTHGKRIFRMAPIHHHFELGGWSETKVVTVFTVLTVLLCLVASLGM